MPDGFCPIRPDFDPKGRGSGHFGGPRLPDRREWQRIGVSRIVGRPVDGQPATASWRVAP